MSEPKEEPLPPRLLDQLTLVLGSLRLNPLDANNVRLLVENAYLCGQTDATRAIREQLYPTHGDTER